MTTVIIGPNGCGKTQKVEQEYRFDQKLNFRDSYGVADGEYYLQQRWNSCDYDLVPTVRESLKVYPDGPQRDELLERFGLSALLDKEIILLSSGELRKLQLTKALLRKGSRLIIDNPFIGLDAAARQSLNDVLRDISKEGQPELVLVLSREGDIPDYADRIVRMDGGASDSGRFDTEHEWHPGHAFGTELGRIPDSIKALGDCIPQNEVVAELKDISIRFGDRTILKDLNWTIRSGEKWALQGRNGSGKSTLLSIICADIPQAYACDVSLFGRKRGTGESIWDIKRNIGYVSPELHRAYCHDVPVLDVVASGTHDRYGMYVKTGEELIPQCEFWMDMFGISQLSGRSFLKISSGEQRLALLARAFVKDPELLILDEPLHGLDETNRERTRCIIDAFASRKGKTIIMVSHYEEDFPSCITCRKTLARQ